MPAKDQPAWKSRPWGAPTGACPNPCRSGPCPRKPTPRGNRAHGAVLQTQDQTPVGAGPVYRTEPTSTGTRYTPETPRKPNPCGNRAHGAPPQAHARTPVGAGHARESPTRVEIAPMGRSYRYMPERLWERAMPAIKPNPRGNRAHGAVLQTQDQTPVGAGHARESPTRVEIAPMGRSYKTTGCGSGPTLSGRTDFDWHPVYS
jgi:hypothetical protein